jgi:multidrug efflux pump subunit AcrA (membrane-fusion protein)
LRALGRRSAAAVLLASLCLSCSRPTATKEKEGSRPKEIVFPVEVRPVELRRVDYSVSGIGAVEAFENVQVTARVAGVLERMHFKEGDSVKEGALLAEVEPQRYQLAVASAQASLERSQAARAEAERESARDADRDCAAYRARARDLYTPFTDSPSDRIEPAAVWPPADTTGFLRLMELKPVPPEYRRRLPKRFPLKADPRV